MTDHVELLRQALQGVQIAKPFHIDAIVILPEHLHTIWTLPEGDADYATRWKKIKRDFTHALIQNGVAPTKNKRGEYDLWQRRYWEHTITDDMDLQRHVDYIHFNPVKHGLVTEVSAWPYSSFHRFVRDGLLPLNWGGSSGADNIKLAGEYKIPE
ncbi:REP-associated tyrosine transposase [Undibacterium sp. TJN25]|uniref:REP-associated tyrosine transposase n=1 Tax=Undibacterium sp. TJN25 TaxID=3413056 RepID=UPI003BF3F0C9